MRWFLAATLWLPVVGCSSIVDMASGENGQRVYGGTQRNVALINGKDVVTHGGVLEVVIGVCDFPFSLALDTGFIPVTLIVALFRTGPEK